MYIHTSCTLEAYDAYRSGCDFCCWPCCNLQKSCDFGFSCSHFSQSIRETQLALSDGAHGTFSSLRAPLYITLKQANQVTWCKWVKKKLTSSSIKFCELCQSCLVSHCVTVPNCDKVEMAQAKTGGLSCGWVEPTHGEGLYWGDESRVQGASAC